MRPCAKCDGKVAYKRGNYHYLECGLDYITLGGMEIGTCNTCGHRSVKIPAITELHALIAMEVATKKEQLSPQEIRFLRKHLGFSSKDFAKQIGVTPEHLSRWENGKSPCPSTAERLIRLLAWTTEPQHHYARPDLAGLGAEPATANAGPLRLEKRKSWAVAA